MRARTTGLMFLLVVGTGLLALRTSGQERPGTIVPAVNKGERSTPLPANASAAGASKDRPPRDFSKLPPLQKQMVQSAQRGAEWLYRVNGNDGRFVHGYIPSLKTVMAGDDFLRQAGAALALARAARFTGDERYAVRARQALLLLLSDTTLDPKKPGVRTFTLPPVVVNRLAAAGLLVLAVHELPAPADDLLQQAEELCAYIRAQQQADGALACAENPADTKTATLDSDGLNFFPGIALYGLMRSQDRRPAAWKTDLVRKARGYYHPWWRAHKNMPALPWLTAAYAEAFLRTREPAFVESIQEMNDWLCELQYPLLCPRNPLWGGGFMSWQDGRPAATPPHVHSALYAEGLAQACRAARKAGDGQHYRRYRDALERCLQFLTRLQYSDANSQHFADWYRPAVLGAFYFSPQEGNVRIDYTQHATCALFEYLTEVLE